MPQPKRVTPASARPAGPMADRRSRRQRTRAAERDAAIIEAVVAEVLAPPRPQPEPVPCREPGSGHAECREACGYCGWHRPYCACV